jgi:hypothetical protein
MTQKVLPLGPQKAQFFHDGRHYSVHREGEMVTITFGDMLIRQFRYSTEHTPLEQRAQWKIEEEDPLLVLNEEPEEDDNAET